MKSISLGTINVFNGHSHRNHEDTICSWCNLQAVAVLAGHCCSCIIIAGYLQQQQFLRLADNQVKSEAYHNEEEATSAACGYQQCSLLWQQTYKLHARNTVSYTIQGLEAHAGAMQASIKCNTPEQPACCSS